MVKYSEIVKRRFILVGFIIATEFDIGRVYVRDAKVIKTHLTSDKLKSTGVKTRLTKIDESSWKKQVFLKKKQKQDRTLTLTNYFWTKLGIRRLVFMTRRPPAETFMSPGRRLSSATEWSTKKESLDYSLVPRRSRFGHSWTLPWAVTSREILARSLPDFARTTDQDRTPRD